MPSESRMIGRRGRAAQIAQHVPMPAPSRLFSPRCSSVRTCVLQLGQRAGLAQAALDTKYSLRRYRFAMAESKLLSCRRAAEPWRDSIESCRRDPARLIRLATSSLSRCRRSDRRCPCWRNHRPGWPRWAGPCGEREGELGDHEHAQITIAANRNATSALIDRRAARTLAGVRIEHPGHCHHGEQKREPGGPAPGVVQAPQRAFARTGGLDAEQLFQPIWNNATHRACPYHQATEVSANSSPSTR